MHFSRPRTVRANRLPKQDQLTSGDSTQKSRKINTLNRKAAGFASSIPAPELAL